MTRKIFGTLTGKDGKSIEVQPPEWVQQLIEDIEGFEFVCVKTASEVVTFTVDAPPEMLPEPLRR